MNNSNIINLSDIIGRTVELSGTGPTCKGLCPLHVERISSFTVKDVRGWRQRYDCGAPGCLADFAKIGGTQ